MKHQDYTCDAAVVADAIDRQTAVKIFHDKEHLVYQGEATYIPNPPPEFVESGTELETLNSLADYIRLHAVDTPVVFAHKRRSIFTVVFDYHVDADHPGRCKNTAYLELRFDERFLAFKEVFKEWLSQEDFIDLIEENEAAFKDPDSAKMLELAQNLEINISHKVVNKRRSQSGAGEIRWETEEGEHSTRIPEQIELGLPIYSADLTEEGNLRGYKIPCRLRYRVNEGKVVFQLIPIALIDRLDEAWNSICEQVKAWEVTEFFEGSF